MDRQLLDDVRTRLEAEKVTLEKQLAEHGVEVDGEGLQVDTTEGFADSAQVTAERSQLISMIEQLQTRHRDATEALAKLDAGTYGKCENCGKDIPVERLEAIPATRLCMECKQLTA
jgi:RNA polymerase-binding transcription factor DksA